MSQEIKDWLKLLYVKRGMSFNEMKLIIGIEDPRLADRRERYGIEDESGCSAEEKIQVLQDVDEGRVPTDIVKRRVSFERVERVTWIGFGYRGAGETRGWAVEVRGKLRWTRLELKDERETRRECWIII